MMSNHVAKPCVHLCLSAAMALPLHISRTVWYITSVVPHTSSAEAACVLQAMMELGACVCTVHHPPACSSCPIGVHCEAYQDVQDYVDQGGQVSDLEAPLVTQYPSKVSIGDLVAGICIDDDCQVPCLICKPNLFSTYCTGQ